MQEKITDKLNLDSFHHERLNSIHPDTMTVEIRSYILRDFGVDISYNRSWKGNELALEEIHGSWEES